MQFHIEDDTLTIRFQGGEMLWAMARKLVIRKEQITHATWHDQFITQRRELGWRIGAAIPGWLYAGRFYAPGCRNFLYMQGAQGLFRDIRASHVLEVHAINFAYDRLLITVVDPDMAEQIISWWASKS